MIQYRLKVINRLTILLLLVLCLLILFIPILTLAATSLDDLPGDLDPSFGAGGIVTTTIGSSAYGRAMVIQPDDKIVVAGDSTTSNGLKTFALARYDTQGNLDATFGISGVVTTPIGLEATGYDLVLQPDQKLVLAGTSQNLFALARYETNGNLDPTFGNGGVVTTPIEAEAYGNAVVLQPDNKIVVTGSSSNGFS